MKFMLFMSVDPSVTLSPEQKANMPAAVGAWVAEMDEALEVASKHPVATFGVLELRPFAG